MCGRRYKQRKSVLIVTGDPPLAGGPDSEGSGEPFHRVARHRAVPTARKGDAGEA